MQANLDNKVAAPEEWTSRQRERDFDFTPVITPDVLCETDVDGAVTAFTMCWTTVVLADDFGKFRMICAFSLPPSPTTIVSIWRDCPRDRCWGNVDFLSLDATLTDVLIRCKVDSIGFTIESSIWFLLVLSFTALSLCPYLYRSRTTEIN